MYIYIYCINLEVELHLQVGIPSSGVRLRDTPMIFLSKCMENMLHDDKSSNCGVTIIFTPQYVSYMIDDICYNGYHTHMYIYIVYPLFNDIYIYTYVCVFLKRRTSLIISVDQ